MDVPSPAQVYHRLGANVRLCEPAVYRGFGRIHDEVGDVKLDIPAKDIPKQWKYLLIIKQLQQGIVFDDGTELR